MNKVYVSNVVSRYSNNIVKDVSNKIPKVATSSYSGLARIVEHELPTAAADRVSEFFAACKNIKAAESKNDSVKVGLNKKQRASIKRKEREDKLNELKREEQFVEQEKLIARKVERYQIKLRAKLVKRARSCELADRVKQQVEGRADSKSNQILKSKIQDKVKQLANKRKPVVDSEKLKNKRVKRNFRAVNKMKKSEISTVMDDIELGGDSS